MKNFQKVISNSFLAVSALFLAFVSSCGEDSGLGPSVDTKAPTVEIQYPSSEATIRGTFVVGGEWTDDKSIKSVSVSVYKVLSVDETERVMEPKNATISGDKWQISLNNYDESNSSYFNGYEFSDGTYIISATAYDNAGHDSGEASRTFHIDNTAPVLVLTKPTSIGTQTPKSYGRTVQLEGLFAESCSTGISKLIVSFYNENGQGLLDAEFTDITDMTHANPLTVAQYYDEKDRAGLTGDKLTRWQNYLKLYGQENVTNYENGISHSEKIYFTVTAIDAAKSYTDFEGGTFDSTGNSSSEFYRGTTEMLKLVNSQNSDFPNFTALSLRDYINKSDLSEYSDAEISALEEIRAAAKSESTTVAASPSVDSAAFSNTSTESGKVYLNFTINPQNNPTYTVNGYVIYDSDSDNYNSDNYYEGYFYYYAGSNINVSFTYGTDLTNLKTNTISIYYAPVVKDADGKEKVDSENKKLFWTFDKTVAMNYENIIESELTANPDTYRYTVTTDSENTDSLNISSSLSSEQVESGTKYRFIVEGNDLDGQTIMASESSGFGLFAKTTTPVPTIILDAYDSSSPNKNLDTMSVFARKVFEGDVDSGSEFSFSGLVKTKEEFTDIEAAMSYNLILTDAADSSKKYSLNDNYFTVTRKDDVEPNLTNEEASDDYYEYTWNFTIKGTDENFKKIIDESTSGLFTVAVTIYAKNGGGSAKKDFTYYLDIEQSEIINLSLAANESGYSAYEKSSGFYYINNTKGTFILSGTTTDNYKIGSTSYTITGVTSDGTTAKTISAESPSSEISWSFAGIDLSGFGSTTGDCDATITISTTDQAGNSSSATLTLKFDTASPSWKNEWREKDAESDTLFQVGGKAYSFDENAWEKLWFKDTSLPVHGCYEEKDSGVAAVYYWVVQPGDSSPTTTELSSAKGSFSNLTSYNEIAYFTNTLGSFDANDTTKSPAYNTLYLVAVDNVGNASSAQTINLNLDMESPSLLTQTGGNQYTNKVSDITFNGTYTDNASGVASVVIKVNGKTQEATCTHTDYTDGKAGSWSATLSASGEILKSLGDSSYPVEATITDNAGISSSSTILTLNIDTSAPTISIETPTPNTSSSVNKINGTVSITGKGNYDGAEPKSLQVYYSTTAPTASTTLETLASKTIGSEITGTAAISSWSIAAVDVKTLSGLTADAPSKTLYIIPVVTDTAGNCNVYTQSASGEKSYSYKQNENYFVYTVDQNTDRPIIQITSLSNDSYAWSTDKLEGTISDDDGIASFYIAETESVPGESSNDWKGVTLDSSKTNWSYTLTTGDGQNKKVFFKVTDTAGTTFITRDTRLFARPYYLYSGMTASDSAVTVQNNDFEDYGLDSNSAVTLNVDTQAPAVYTLGIDRGTVSSSTSTDSEADILIEAITVSESAATYAPSASLYTGGSYKYMRFFVPAFDVNIDTVTLTISNASTGEDETSSYKYLDGTTEKKISSSIALSKVESATITSEGTTYTYYQSAPIVVSNATTGRKSFTVTVKDKAGNEKTASGVFSVDNAGASNVNVTSPDSSTSLTGTVKIIGSASDGTSESGLALTEVLIPAKGYTYSVSGGELSDSYDASALESQFGDWNKDLNLGTSSSFRFTFTSGTANDLTQFEAQDSSGSYIYAVTKQSDDTFIIPILIRTTDNVGNKYIKHFYITHDPDGDRPVTALSYPTESDYDKNESGELLTYKTLSGVIRVNGTVKVPSNTCSVGNVYLQIASVASDGSVSWSSTDSELLGEFTSLGGVVTAEKIKSTYNSTTYVSSDWWGLEATTKSKTWNISLNKDSKLEKDNDTRRIAIRACAINEEGKMGVWTDPVYINVNSSAPTQSAEVRKYNSFSFSSPNTNILSSKEFSAEMYLKGTQYLVVKLHDNDELKDVEVRQNGSVLSASTYTASDTTYTYQNGSTSTTKSSSDTNPVTSADKTLYIPVDTTSISYNSVTFTVSVSDGQFSSEGTYTFNIDNTPPTIQGTYDNQGAELQTSLLSTGVTDSNPVSIVNSNYTYSIEGTINETGSGFSKFFFYLMRDKNQCTDNRTTSTLFDPALTDGNVSIDMTNLDHFTVSQGESTYTMYGKTYTSGSLDSERTTFTASGISSDAHIRAGGLIYIGGEYQVIKSKSGDAVTFEDAISETLTVTSASFPYGQLIDSTAEIMGSTMNSDYTYPVTNDDGDGMPESVKAETGSNWSISGVLYSDRMSDGPVTFVCIAFDEAGNVSGKTVKTKIQNNAPRLAKLYLGTDLTGDGKYSDSEFNAYAFATPDSNGYITSDQYVTEKELATADSSYGYKKAFKIRSGLVVVPEITGGNGAIKMAWLKDASSATGYQKSSDVASNGEFYSVDTTSSVTATFAVSRNTGTKKDNGDYQADTTHIFIIPDSVLPSGENAADQKMSFTFWDATDGTKQGTDSQYCFVCVTDFTVDRGDTTKPTSVFSPFYWNSSSDNSVYGNSSSNGHIELEKDWQTTAATGYSSSATSGITDGDPKVSGKITMKGYAYDNQRLNSIWISFDDFTVANYLSSGGDASKTLSSVNASNGTYTLSGDGKTYYQAVYYNATGDNAGEWTQTEATMDSNGWSFSVSDAATDGAYLSQDGHKVFYTLSIDTERISGTAGTDKKARIIAFDHNGNVVSVATSDIKTPYAVSNLETKTDGTDNAPYYQMDIVPYITTVTTALSSANQNKPSVYARTALGHYPVYDYRAQGNGSVTYEKLTIAGFNLKSGATVTLEGTSDNTGTLGDDLTFTIPSGAKSGEVSVTVNSVGSLNNKNNNASKGDYAKTPSAANGDYTIYSNYYNRQPNNVNNNNLTDDVILDIWDFNTEAALAYGSGKVDNLEMKINPANGMIGFAFSNGTLRFAMPKADSSYTQWSESYDYMSHNALAFDSYGNSYAVSVGGDINSGGAADQYSFMTSRWGVVGDNDQGLNNSSSKHLHLDTIGQTNSGVNKHRFQNQSFATHKNSTENSTDVYLAYYDLTNTEIRFKAGTITVSTSESTAFGNFTEIGTNISHSYTDNAKSCQIIAKGDSSAAENTLGTAGQYVSVGVTSDNVVVIVWFDGTDLKYAYNAKPLENVDQTAVTYAKNTGWTDTKTLISNAGEYCQLVVANDDSIHIACYDSMNADLKYVYIPAYNSATSEIIKSTVDSYLDVGEQLTIDVAKVGEYQVPYIGYWGSYPEKPRYAYLAAPATFYEKTTKDGAVSDTYTGVWECTVVPTQSSVKDQRKMNVGVWKKDGALAYSTEDFAESGKNKYTDSYAKAATGSDGGVCYGNGTSNGVMAYVVAPSSSQYNAETAQKR